MPKAVDKKKTLLQDLRSNYIQFGFASQYAQQPFSCRFDNPEMRKEFVDLVALQVQHICQDKAEILDDDVVKKKYGENVQNARKGFYHSSQALLTQEELGKCIGCSNAMISYIEKASVKSAIDRYFLEAFSLIFQLFPHNLLDAREIGEERDSAGDRKWSVSPCRFFNTSDLAMPRAITLNLYSKENSSLEYKLAHLFDTFIGLKDPDDLVSCLKKIPILESLYKQPAIISPDAVEKRWNQELSLSSVLSSQNAAQAACYSFYQDLCRRLAFLQEQEPDFVELMYHISAGDTEIKEFAYFVLKKGQWTERCEFRDSDEQPKIETT